MALFFDYKCQAPQVSETICIDWHPRFPQLAVGTANGAVNVYLDEVNIGSNNNYNN